jgi:predicted DCC family thiol-disulfide oxidoreductase YuxK
VLLYDGSCRFCRFAARAVATLDRHRRIALLPLEDHEAEALLASLPEQERFASWHIAQPGGRISSRGGAGVDLLDALGYKLPARAASRLDGSIEWLYRLVSENRDKLGHLVPDGPAPRRFP